MIVAANVGGVTEVTEKTAFDAVVVQGIVVVDFWAPWRKNCHRDAPVIKLAIELTGVKFMKVNTAEAEEMSVELGVEALPTFLFYHPPLKKIHLTHNVLECVSSIYRQLTKAEDC